MTPSLSDLYASVLSDLRNRFSITTLFGKVIFNAFALVQAAKLKLYYLHAAFIYKNIFPDTADPASIGGSLSRFGVVKLGRLLLPATAGEYTVDVTGVIGAVIPPNTTFKSLDTSTSPDKLFVLDTTFTFTATSGQIQIRALDLGADAKLEVGDSLQVTQPIADVDSFATVDSVDTIPIEAETTAEYSQKVIQAYSQEAQGGAKTDYRIWAADAAGEREVYPYVIESGMIDLYIEANPADSLDGFGTPTAAIIAEVEEVVEFDPDTTKSLNERGRRPMGTFQINFEAVNVLPVDVEITTLSDVSFLTAIEDAIVAYLFNIRPYIDGADNPNDSQKGLLYEADIYGIVRGVLGSQATFVSLTVEVDSTPIAIYEFTTGDIPYLNSVTNV